MMVDCVWVLYEGDNRGDGGVGSDGRTDGGYGRGSSGGE